MDNKLNSATKVERRGHPRIYQPFLTTLRDYNGPACGLVFKIETVLDNLSASGMYLRLAQRVGEGTEIHAFIQLPKPSTTQEASSQLVATRGVVLRAKPQPDGMCGIAVAFKQPILEHLMQQFRRAEPEVRAVPVKEELPGAPATAPVPEASAIAQETLRVEAAQTAQPITGDIRSAAEETAARESQEEASIQRAEAEARRKAQEEASRLARDVEEAQRRAEEARKRAEVEAARIRAAEQKRHRVEAAARKRAEDEIARGRAETEARRIEEEAAQLRAKAVAARKFAEELAAMRRKAEEAARLVVQEEVRKQAEEEARLRAEEAARRKAAEEFVRLRAQEGARLGATALAREQAKKVSGTAVEKVTRKQVEKAQQRAEAEATFSRAQEYLPAIPSSSKANISDQNSAPPTSRVMDIRRTNPPRRTLPSSAIYLLALGLGILITPLLASWVASRRTPPERSVTFETSPQPPTTNAPLPEEHQGTSDRFTSSQASSPKTVHVYQSRDESVFTESPSLAALTKTDKREVKHSARTNSTLVAQARPLKVKSEGGALRIKEELRPERRTFENLYDKRARAIRNKDFKAVMEFFAPYYSAVLPNGQTLNYEQIRDDVRRGMKKFVSIINMNFTIEKLTVRGNQAIVDARQDFSRKQRLRDGKTHTIIISVLQRETWTKTAWGWKLRLVDNFRIQSMTVDGNPVRPSVLYDFSP
ncbi:MAG: PilZ domain-containing protein [Pyrinomonadaceae bacterium]|nr:PilZ domain-containing protein [Pyrinomonadaceae bacterium]